MAAVEVHGLGKRYGTVDAVADVTFSVEAGEIAALVGPNGAGKSTAIGVMVGLLRGRGECLFEGRPFAALERPGRTVGVLADTPSFFPRWTAREHLGALAPVVGAPPARVDELLELVDLAGAAAQQVRGFSLGMRQRLGLATALLGRPRVLVLDEPGVGLDPYGMRWLSDLLRGFAAEGGSVLVSSHQLAELEEVAHSVVLLRAGRLVERDSLAGFLRRHTPDVVRLRADGAERLVPRLELAGARVLARDGELLRVSGPGPREVARLAVEAGVLLHELAPEGGALQDAFFAASAGAPAGRSA